MNPGNEERMSVTPEIGRTEQAVRESEARTRAILDSAADAIITIVTEEIFHHETAARRDDGPSDPDPHRG